MTEEIQNNGNPGGTPPAAPVAAPITPPGGEKPAQGAISMTQEQLTERLERAGRAAVNGLWKELGYESLDAFKVSLKPATPTPPAKQPEPPANSDELKKAQERLTQAEARAQQAETGRLQAELKSEALALMSEKFIDPRTALRLLDMSGVKRGEDGKITGLAEAIAQLEKDAPWALKPTGKPGPRMPQIGPTNPPGSKPVLESEAEKRQRYFGLGEGTGFFRGGGVTAPPNRS